VVAGVIELGPFTRAQSVDLPGLLRVKRFRSGYVQMAMVIVRGRLQNWKKYLDVAYPTKPADWTAELARIEAGLTEPGRMDVLQAMCRSNPADAGARLADVTCPVLVVEGSLDPDWADPRAEGQKILADLPDGIGELAIIEGAGHYPHAQTPDEVLALALPFLSRNLARA
jgi:pimeloyl-ACP methyl ester carboxylesterase